MDEEVKENKVEEPVEERTTVVETIQEDRPLQYNVCGLLSFIFSLVGLLIFGMPCGTAAVILGIIGLCTFKKELHKGKGLTIAGIIIGAVDIIFVFLYAMMKTAI